MPRKIMRSIEQKPQSPVARAVLPDFRNLGVLLRVLLVANLLAIGTVLIVSADLAALPLNLLVMAGRLELPLVIVAMLLYVAQPWLAREPPRRGLAAVLGGVAAVVWLVHPLLGAGVEGAGLGRWLAWAVAASGLILLYFDYRSRRLSPAATEARLMALTARIRPHFLFNSLNGVLGVIRSDPRRAERALEELADLFRAVLRDNRELVPLADELALCERYLDLERLRLGERLQVSWDTAQCPQDALVPPLLLQPLVENAVYHGIEPAAEAGVVGIRLYRRGNELRLEVDNPLADAASPHAGNRMALDNIRERLMLFFDLEAGLDIVRSDGRHRVRIRLPYRRSAK